MRATQPEEFYAAHVKEADLLKSPVDPVKAVALVESMRSRLCFNGNRYRDPLYGWVGGVYWPEVVLVEAERIVACGQAQNELPSL